MRPYTENFSDAMVIKCDEFNLKLKTESDEENRLSSYNSSIRLELVRDAFAENKALQQELSEHWGAQNQIKRQQRLLAEHERRQQSASMRDTQLRTRAEEYSKQSERRRDDLLQKIAKKKKLRSDQFDKQYMLLKDEFQNFVQGKVDKEIAMREAKKQQRVRDLHATYKLEVTRKMHSQVMSVIHDLPSDEITLRRRKMFDKYLEITNRKNVYLDEVDVAEYDPFDTGGKVVKYIGGGGSNCAAKGDDADNRLGEDPGKRERNKLIRERELAISMAQGSGHKDDVVTQVMEAVLAKHANTKRQSSMGAGNPHMQATGKNADLAFRDTLSQFLWNETNFKDSQFYDRPLKANTGGLSNLKSTIDLNDYVIPQGRARGSEQQQTLNAEFNHLYGKGKRCLEEAPGRH